MSNCCFCHYCCKIGHGEKLCRTKMLDSRNKVLVEGQFGEWLPANNGRPSFKARFSVHTHPATSSLKEQVLGSQQRNVSEGGHKVLGSIG